MGGKYRRYGGALGRCAVLLPVLLLPFAWAVTAAASEEDKGARMQRVEQLPAGVLDDLRNRFQNGNALLKEGRLEAAIALFRQLTQDYPHQPEPYNNLATAYAQTGDLDRAQATLQAALKTQAAFATIQANLNRIYEKKAAQAYARALTPDVIERQNEKQQASADKPLLDRTETARQGVPAEEPSGQTLRLENLAQLTPMPGLAAPRTGALRSKSLLAQVGPSVEKPADVSTPKAAAPPSAEKPAEQRVDKPIHPAQGREATRDIPPALAPPATEVGQSPRQQVETALHAWATAWSRRDVAAYLAAYQPAFSPGDQSHAAWAAQRKERILAAQAIQVKLTQMWIVFDGPRATARVIQFYQSDKIKQSTRKTLWLEKSGGRWLIVREQVGG